MVTQGVLVAGLRQEHWTIMRDGRATAVDFVDGKADGATAPSSIALCDDFARRWSACLQRHPDADRYEMAALLDSMIEAWEDDARARADEDHEPLCVVQVRNTQDDLARRGCE